MMSCTPYAKDHALTNLSDGNTIVLNDFYIHGVSCKIKNNSLPWYLSRMFVCGVCIHLSLSFYLF